MSCAVTARSKTYALVGASRGIGAAVATHLVAQGARVLAASRTQAAAGDWVRADVATEAGIEAIVHAVGDGPLDALLYLGGIWEDGAFTKAYDFAKSSRAETQSVIGVNLVAPILLSQALAPALARAARPRILLMGSLSGLPNRATPEVANTAAKFGLQGAAQALTLSLRRQGIGVTILNPGNVATAEVEADIAAGRFPNQLPIAMSDLLLTIDYILSIGPSALPAEITLDQMHPGQHSLRPEDETPADG